MPDATINGSTAAAPQQQANIGTTPADQHGKLPPKIYGIMAATTFATWGTLAGSYQLLF